MTLPQLLLPILMAAATPAPSSPATTAPAATSPAVAAPEAPATPPPAKLEFPLAGYRINTLETSVQSNFNLTMFLPNSDQKGSRPQINVAMQPTTERPSFPNLKGAKAIRAHFDDTILLERTPSSTEWLMEYTSNKTGTKEHTYERVLSSNGMAYDISATAPDTQWSEFGPKLKACVDSFELTPIPAPGKMVFPQQGFRINKLDGALPADANLTLFSMSNVSFGISPYVKTLKDFQAEHKPRATFWRPTPNQKNAFKIVSEYVLGENTLVTEYLEELPIPGSTQVSHMHIYEKAIFDHGQYYWATGLYWDGEKGVSSAQIKTCVESLEEMPIPANVPASVPMPPPVAPAPVK